MNHRFPAVMAFPAGMAFAPVMAFTAVMASQPSWPPSRHGRPAVMAAQPSWRDVSHFSWERDVGWLPAGGWVWTEGHPCRPGGQVGLRLKAPGVAAAIKSGA
jgi:hypothetical protein